VYVSVGHESQPAKTDEPIEVSFGCVLGADMRGGANVLSRCRLTKLMLFLPPGVSPWDRDVVSAGVWTYPVSPFH